MWDLGDFPAVLEVTNEYGKDVFEFTVTVVIRDWLIGGIDSTTKGIFDLDAKLIGVRPMVAYLVDTIGSECEELKFAFGPEGGVASWSRCVVDFIQLPSAVALAEVAGKPMIAYSGRFASAEPDEVRVAVARSAEPAQGDWDIYKVAEAYGTVDICEVQGRPAVVYVGYEQPDNSTTVWYSINTEPDGSGEWQDVEVTWAYTESSGEGFYNLSLSVFDGRPAVVYSLHDEGVPRLYFAIADSADGLGTWSSKLIITYALPLGPTAILAIQGSHSLAEVDGRPAVATYYVHRPLTFWECGAEMKYLICDSADGMGEWSETTVYPRALTTSFDVRPSLAVIEGKPVLAFGDFGNVYESYRCALWCFTCDTADGLEEWKPTSLVNPLGGASRSLIRLADGTPSIVYVRAGVMGYAAWYGPGTL